MSISDPHQAQAADRGAAHIDVTIPARAADLPLLRGVAAALAISRDFDIDAVADLRMAVDELGATLVTRARPDEMLTCRLTADDDSVTVSGATPVADREPVDRDSFGWMVLTTLVDDVRSDIETDGSSGQPVLRLSLTLRRRAAP